VNVSSNVALCSSAESFCIKTTVGSRFYFDAIQSILWPLTMGCSMFEDGDELINGMSEDDYISSQIASVQPVQPTYTVGDSGSRYFGLSFSEAANYIAEWYKDVDTWSDGVSDTTVHDAVAKAIGGIDAPVDGDIDTLQEYAIAIREAVALACGQEPFYGHGSYYVSAADHGGYDLSVCVDQIAN